MYRQIFYNLHIKNLLFLKKKKKGVIFFIDFAYGFCCLTANIKPIGDDANMAHQARGETAQKFFAALFSLSKLSSRPTPSNVVSMNLFKLVR